MKMDTAQYIQMKLEIREKKIIFTFSLFEDKLLKFYEKKIQIL